MNTLQQHLRLFLIAAGARTWPRVVHLLRNRQWLVSETLLPLLSVAAMVYAYRFLQAPPEYAGIVILGQAMTAFWFNVLWSMGAHLYWERDGGNLELYILAPAPMTGILAGMALGGAITTSIRAFVILAGGLVLFHIPFAPTSWPLLVLIFALTLAALYGLGMMFASLFLIWGREAWHTVNLLQEPVFLLTGMNFPLRALGTMLGSMILPGVALLIPLACGMDAMRQVLFRVEGVTGVWAEVGLLAVLSVVFLLLARVCLRNLERKAKEDGRLTTKWQ
jgi:ABC-2 type transport system permease protein